MISDYYQRQEQVDNILKHYAGCDMLFVSIRPDRVRWVVSKVETVLQHVLL